MREMEPITCVSRKLRLQSGNGKLTYVSPIIEIAFFEQQMNILVGSAMLRPAADPQVYEWEEEVTPEQGDIYF